MDSYFCDECLERDTVTHECLHLHDLCPYLKVGNMTKIEWCDKSWNPITGCTAVSTGCNNCYARRTAYGFRGKFGYPEEKPFKIVLRPERERQPFHWRKARKIFVCSMSDLFHEDIPFATTLRIFDIFRELQRHTFIVLTKRPKRGLEFLIEWKVKVPRNVWFGVSAENQKAADERIPILLQIPAKVRFVSIEPMLEDVDLTRFIGKLNWALCGAETGREVRRGEEARPMKLEWAVSLLKQCRAASVPFFMKKLSDKEDIPDDLMVREFPG